MSTKTPHTDQPDLPVDAEVRTRHWLEALYLNFPIFLALGLFGWLRWTWDCPLFPTMDDFPGSWMFALSVLYILWLVPGSAQAIADSEEKRRRELMNAYDAGVSVGQDIKTRRGKAARAAQEERRDVLPFARAAMPSMRKGG